eukprot:10017458-Ditylum_brightwellii.AAC.1
MEKAYTMLYKRRNNGTLIINIKSQLVLHVKGEGGKEEESGEEIVPPAGGGKVRPYIRFNKCNKKGHNANKCLHLIKEKEEEVLAFIIEGEEDPQADKSNGENEFIFLTTCHKTVNKNMLLLDNQSLTNIICNRKYVTNIRKVKRMLTLHYFKHSTNTNYMCDVPGYGTSWFHEKGAVNIL